MIPADQRREINTSVVGVVAAVLMPALADITAGTGRSAEGWLMGSVTDG